MRSVLKPWRMGIAIPAAIAATLMFGGTFAALLIFDLYRPQLMDRFDWPGSGQARIENMAQILRDIRAPARWCYPSANPANTYVFRPREGDTNVGRCLAMLAPVSAFQETEPGYYVKRLYRAEIGNTFCEVTLSTVFADDRVVGSDCYFGFFPKEKDTGIGMTDDRFG